MNDRSIELRRISSVAFAVVLFVFISGAAYAADPLPSWNDGAAKTAIINFVTTVTEDGGSGFVPPGERIAVFDNDGTL
ncbi:MAG: haloacid dehalogenase-like hydrolase, partial [bacterium]